MVFCIFVRFPSFITIVFIFYLLVIFPSQTRIRVNIKVVQCLKYSASLVSTQSVLRRNSDNSFLPAFTTGGHTVQRPWKVCVQVVGCLRCCFRNKYFFTGWGC